MGPGCFHPRNYLDPTKVTAAMVLQWGRDVSIPEMTRMGRIPRGPTIASMGPGCFHPRNGASRTGEDTPGRASMGPGCFHPRNRFTFAYMSLTILASMGPGCFHPRNVFVGRGTRAEEGRVGKECRSRWSP